MPARTVTVDAMTTLWASLAAISTTVSLLNSVMLLEIRNFSSGANDRIKDPIIKLVIGKGPMQRKCTCQDYVFNRNIPIIRKRTPFHLYNLLIPPWSKEVMQIQASRIPNALWSKKEASLFNTVLYPHKC